MPKYRLPAKDELLLAVLADTHVPVDVPHLRAEVLDSLRSLSVDFILHAGDICEPSALKTLRKIAPVLAVRGNRDLFLADGLYNSLLLEWEGLKISLVHGHGGFFRYIVDKYFYLTRGYSYERYAQMLLKCNPSANVIIFGHTHYPVNSWYNQVLLFNPGSAGVGMPPSFGLLRLKAGCVEGEIKYSGRKSS